MTRHQFFFAVVFAGLLQWWSVLHAHGMMVYNWFATLLSACFWMSFVALSSILGFNLRSLVAVFVIVFLADLAVSVRSFVVDQENHARDIPLAYRPLISFAFASIASSGLFLAYGAKLLWSK